MIESQQAKPHSYYLAQQLHVEALSADMVQLRCNTLLQQNIWQQQRRQLQHYNQHLLLNLWHAAMQHASMHAELQQLKLDSQCDGLTQTLNRNFMLDRINHNISIAKREKSQFALLFIDLDNFKPVNDQYGHAAGDAVLQQVSARLSAAIRDSDAISRHGGDEFLVLVNNVKSTQTAIAFAVKLVNMLKQPYQLAEQRISLSASIGIALFPAQGSSAAALINSADSAMYKAKQQGGDQIFCFAG